MRIKTIAKVFARQNYLLQSFLRINTLLACSLWPQIFSLVLPPQNHGVRSRTSKLLRYSSFCASKLLRSLSRLKTIAIVFAHQTLAPVFAHQNFCDAHQNYRKSFCAAKLFIAIVLAHQNFIGLFSLASNIFACSLASKLWRSFSRIKTFVMRIKTIAKVFARQNYLLQSFLRIKTLLACSLWPQIFSLVLSPQSYGVRSRTSKLLRSFLRIKTLFACFLASNHFRLFSRLKTMAFVLAHQNYCATVVFAPQNYCDRFRASKLLRSFLRIKLLHQYSRIKTFVMRIKTIAKVIARQNYLLQSFLRIKTLLACSLWPQIFSLVLSPQSYGVRSRTSKLLRSFLRIKTKLACSLASNHFRLLSGLKTKLACSLTSKLY